MRTNNQIFLKSFDPRFVDESKVCKLSVVGPNASAFKKYGLKIVVGFLMYYLISDAGLYLSIPSLLLTQN